MQSFIADAAQQAIDNDFVPKTTKVEPGTTVLLDRHPAPGTYHGTNSGVVSWFDFTREIFRLAAADPDRVLPTTSAEFVRPAPRPAYSVLGHDRWAEQGLPEMRPWQEALEAAFTDGIADG